LVRRGLGAVTARAVHWHTLSASGVAGGVNEHLLNGAGDPLGGFASMATDKETWSAACQRSLSL